MLQKAAGLTTVSPFTQQVQYMVVWDNTPTSEFHSGLHYQAKLLSCETIEAFGKKDLLQIQVLSFWMLVSNSGTLSPGLVDGNHCFGRTNNVRGLQWRPDRNVRKTTWQREKGMNFKRPPFESKRQSAGWTNKTCQTMLMSTLTVEAVSHAPPCDVTPSSPPKKEKEEREW